MSARAVSVWFIDSDDAITDVRIGLINDVEDAKRLAATLFGDSVLVPVVDTDLATAVANNDSHVYAGSFGSLAVVSCPLFATVRPSSLTKTIASMRESPAATLLYTSPGESIGAFARWEKGELRRSLSANPVDLYEDEGLPFVFEGPFWGGEHPLRYAPGVAPEPLALPFHPQQLAEQSNREWLGFRFTHPLAATDSDPARIPVTAFAIHPAGYRPTDADLQEYRRRSSAPAGPGSAVPIAPAPGPVSMEQATAAPAPEQARPKRGRFARYFGFGATKESRPDDAPPPPADSVQVPSAEVGPPPVGVPPAPTMPSPASAAPEATPVVHGVPEAPAAPEPIPATEVTRPYAPAEAPAPIDVAEAPESNAPAEAPEPKTPEPESVPAEPAPPVVELDTAALDTPEPATPEAEAPAAETPEPTAPQPESPQPESPEPELRSESRPGPSEPHEQGKHEKPESGSD